MAEEATLSMEEEALKRKERLKALKRNASNKHEADASDAQGQQKKLVSSIVSIYKNLV